MKIFLWRCLNQKTPGIFRIKGENREKSSQRLCGLLDILRERKDIECPVAYDVEFIGESDVSLSGN